MTKRILLLFLFALASMSGMAQSQAAMSFDNDFIWCYNGCKSAEYLTYPAFQESYRFDGSYEKNGKQYHVFHFQRAFFDSGASIYPTGYSSNDFKGQIGVREENGRVYVDRNEYLALLSDGSYWQSVGTKDYLPYQETADGELVLYDFNMQVNDKYPSVEGHDDISVVSIDIVTTEDNVARKLLRLSNGSSLLEGIGCIYSSGLWLFYLNPGIVPYEAGYLDIYAHHPQNTGLWTPIYQWNDGALTGISNTISTKHTAKDFLDLQGRPMKELPTKGIYIHNGRKVVVK